MSGRDFTYGGGKGFLPLHQYASFHPFIFHNRCVRLLIQKLHLFMFSKKVYLSGTNTAWISYGYDFGNNAWDDHGDQWIAELDRVFANNIRINSLKYMGQAWIECSWIPFDGYIEWTISNELVESEWSKSTMSLWLKLVLAQPYKTVHKRGQSCLRKHCPSCRVCNMQATFCRWQKLVATLWGFGFMWRGIAGGS